MTRRSSPTLALFVALAALPATAREAASSDCEAQAKAACSQSRTAAACQDDATTTANVSASPCPLATRATSECDGAAGEAPAALVDLARTAVGALQDFIAASLSDETAEVAATPVVATGDAGCHRATEVLSTTACGKTRTATVSSGCGKATTASAAPVCDEKKAKVEATIAAAPTCDETKKTNVTLAAAPACDEKKAKAEATIAAAPTCDETKKTRVTLAAAPACDEKKSKVKTTIAAASTCDETKKTNVTLAAAPTCDEKKAKVEATIAAAPICDETKKTNVTLAAAPACDEKKAKAKATVAAAPACDETEKATAASGACDEASKAEPDVLTWTIRREDGEPRVWLGVDELPEGFSVRGDVLTATRLDDEDAVQWPGIAVRESQEKDEAEASDDRPMLGVLIDESPNGIVIEEVMADSAAKAAGLKAGDVLFRFGDERIEDFASLREAIAATGFGGEAEVTVIREDEGFVTTAVTLPERKAPRRERKQAPEARGPSGFLGVMIEDAGDEGVTVTEIVPDSAAWYAGLAPGDVILALDGKSLDDAEALIERLSGKPVGTFVKLKVSRDGDERTLTARLGRRRPRALAPEALEELRRFRERPEEGSSFFFSPDGEEFSFSFPKGEGGFAFELDDEDLFFSPGDGEEGHGGLFSFGDGEHGFVIPRPHGGHGLMLDLSDLEELEHLDAAKIEEHVRKMVEQMQGAFDGEVIYKLRRSDGDGAPRVLEIEIEDGEVTVTEDGHESEASSVDAFKRRPDGQDL